MTRATQVADGVWRLKLGCSNAYVVSNGRDFWLFDAGTRADLPLLSRLLRDLGLEPSLCGALVLSHAHPDHAGSAAWFSERGARLLLHEREKPFLRGQSYAGTRAVSPFARVTGNALFRAGERVWRAPSREAESLGPELSSPAGTWRVVFTPGHTPGHVALWREGDGVLLSGDAILNVLPFSRREGLTMPLPLYCADERAALRSALMLAALPVRVLLPGHGAPLFDAAPKLQRWAENADGD